MNGQLDFEGRLSYQSFPLFVNAANEICVLTNTAKGIRLPLQNHPTNLIFIISLTC